MAARSSLVRHLPSRGSRSVLPCILLLILHVSVSATVHNVKTDCGATGNGTTDDTSAIKTCIGHLVSGDTLLFPAGRYKTSSALTISVSNVTVDGSNSTATILATG